MNHFNLIKSFLSATTALLALAACDDDNDGTALPAEKPDIEFYALSNDNRLLKFNAMNAASEIASLPLSGLASGERVVAVDFRPATGQLYGVTNQSRLYIINHASGLATALAAEPFMPSVTGEILGFDFNPTVDRIRLVTAEGQNLRLHPETGQVASVDGMLNPGSPDIAAAAYTNSVAGASSTVLFDIDLTTNMLYRQDPPNDGTLVAVGELGLNGEMDASFDISFDNGVALMAASTDMGSMLYTVDLESGKASNIGAFSAIINGIAIPPAPVAYAVSSSGTLQIINLLSVGTPVSKSIAGLAQGETVLGIDMRPANGQLYALGSSSRLYTINMATGAATAIGAAPLTTLPSGDSFGFDFNPTVDRIRVVSNSGQNLRLHPVTGAVAFVDASLNPGSPQISSAAYTNNFPGATTTMLFDIDHNTDKLLMQLPPNEGTLVEVGNLGVDIQANGGFDIGGISQMAYGIFMSGGSSKIYSINTSTGAATALADYSEQVVGFAMGVGF